MDPQQEPENKSQQQDETKVEQQQQEPTQTEDNKEKKDQLQEVQELEQSDKVQGQETTQNTIEQEQTQQIKEEPQPSQNNENNEQKEQIQVQEQSNQQQGQETAQKINNEQEQTKQIKEETQPPSSQVPQENIQQIEQIKQQQQQQEQNYSQIQERKEQEEEKTQQAQQINIVSQQQQQQLLQQPNLPQEQLINQQIPVQLNTLHLLTLDERRERCFQSLREWDSNRSHFLKMHHGYIEIIQTTIDRRIQLSQNFLGLIQNFLVNKCRQEVQYFNFPVNKVPEVANQNNELVGKGYEDIHQTLLVLEKENVHRAQRSAELAELLQEKVIKQIIISHLDLYNQNIESIRHNLINLNKNLKNYYQITTKKSAKFQNLYFSQTNAKQKSKTQQYLSGNFSSDSCLFKKLISYLRRLELQKETQRTLAKYTIEFWNTAKLLEIQRYEALKNALTTVYYGYVKCYGEGPHAQQVKTLLEQVSTENIEKLYEPSLVLISEVYNIENIKPQLQKNIILFEDVQMFMENYHIAPFDHTILELLQLTVQREAGVNNFVKSVIHVSIDGFIHCFDIAKDQDIKTHMNRKPNISFKLKGSKLNNLGNNQVEILQKTNSFLSLLTASERHLYIFNSQQDLEQFQRLFESM